MTLEIGNNDSSSRVDKPNVFGVTTTGYRDSALEVINDIPEGLPQLDIDELPKSATPDEILSGMINNFEIQDPTILELRKVLAREYPSEVLNTLLSLEGYQKNSQHQELMNIVGGQDIQATIGYYNRVQN